MLAAADLATDHQLSIWDSVILSVAAESVERGKFVGHRRMYTVKIYGRVRRAVLVEGKSEHTVAQEFGIARAQAVGKRRSL